MKRLKRDEILPDLEPENGCIIRATVPWLCPSAYKVKPESKIEVWLQYNKSCRERVEPGRNLICLYVLKHKRMLRTCWTQ